MCKQHSLVKLNRFVFQRLDPVGFEPEKLKMIWQLGNIRFNNYLKFEIHSNHCLNIDKSMKFPPHCIYVLFEFEILIAILAISLSMPK